MPLACAADPGCAPPGLGLAGGAPCYSQRLILTGAHGAARWPSLANKPAASYCKPQPDAAIGHLHEARALGSFPPSQVVGRTGNAACRSFSGSKLRARRVAGGAVIPKRASFCGACSAVGRPPRPGRAERQDRPSHPHNSHRRPHRDAQCLCERSLQAPPRLPHRLEPLGAATSAARVVLHLRGPGAPPGKVRRPGVSE